MSLKSNNLPFFNRELSWIAFNKRVLLQAQDSSKPLLERLKFLAIVASNFDEFFSVRIATLLSEKRMGLRTSCPSGLSIHSQITQASKEIHILVKEQYECLNQDILPNLHKEGIQILRPSAYNEDDFKDLETFFSNDVFPALTPLKLESNKPFPLYGNFILHLMFKLKKKDSEEEFTSIVPIPQSLPRFIHLPAPENQLRLALIEDTIIEYASRIFTGYDVIEHTVFRVTRDSDMGVDEDTDKDFVQAMQDLIDSRDHSEPVRLSVSQGKTQINKELCEHLNIQKTELYEIDGPLDLKPFMSLCFTDGFDDLKIPNWKPVPHPDLTDEDPLWNTLQNQDILLHHPYHSFNPIIRLVEEASVDSKVVAIKCTLYRTSGKSPIISSLIRAAKAGIQVTALVELKARFDEEQNIQWAKVLEKAGAIVVYGVANLKVHSKALMIIRQEDFGIRRYVHLGTGNYNEKTATLYTDMGLITSNEVIGYETSLFFNAITGYSNLTSMNQLSVAPTGIKPKIITLIQREIEHVKTKSKGLIIAKMNSLADPEVIKALYKASEAGVQIQLNVRGICMLVPGIPGLSENIEVVSIVDRYLEHTRAFYFHNGGRSETYLSSADWMPRNLDKRIELMFPIHDRKLSKEIKDSLSIYFEDNTQAYSLQSDGSWLKKERIRGKKVLSSQIYFHERIDKMDTQRRRSLMHTKQLKVRRKPPESN